jgi:transcriptional regulator GlxA family with amidase domain
VTLLNLLPPATLIGYGLAEMTSIQHFQPNRRAVEFVAFGDFQLLDVAGPSQVFATANDLARLARQPAPYTLQVVAGSDGLIASSSGMTLGAAALPAPGAPLDTLIVSGGYGVDKACKDEALLAWLKLRAAHARRLCSVCSGALILAAAGLLTGRRVATHWGRCAQLQRQYPEIKVENDPIFVRDGHVWTSAGVTAGVDLALALVEEDLGRATALAVARQLVVFLKRPGGQAQFSAALELQAADERFETLNAWISENLNADLSVPRLAEKAGMSERNFARRYKQATGVSPARAIERLRVEAAQRRLCETREPIKRVAARCGFGGEETMRRSFQRIACIGPQDFRARFSREA